MSVVLRMTTCAGRGAVCAGPFETKPISVSEILRMAIVMRFILRSSICGNHSLDRKPLNRLEAAYQRVRPRGGSGIMWSAEFELIRSLPLSVLIPLVARL